MIWFFNPEDGNRSVFDDSIPNSRDKKGGEENKLCIIQIAERKIRTAQNSSYRQNPVDLQPQNPNYNGDPWDQNKNADQKKKVSTMAIVSLVLGIFGLVLCFVPLIGLILGIIGLVLAIMAKKKKGDHSGVRTEDFGRRK